MKRVAIVLSLCIFGSLFCGCEIIDQYKELREESANFEQMQDDYERYLEKKEKADKETQAILDYYNSHSTTD